MKYIPTEKLIAEIERRQEYLGDHNFHSMASEYDWLLGIVESLQQEQSLPCWIHANYSDKPEIRYTPSGIPYLQNGPHMIWLSDLDTLPKNGTDLTNPIQEQPDVDLEKKIDEYFALWRQGASDEGCFNADSQLVSIYDCRRIARHFYELGLNAGKEEE